jgi:agmatine deiminase
MLVRPQDLQGAQDLCGQDVELIPFPLSDSWTRDTGPSFLTGPGGTLAGVHWLFNAWGGNYDDCELDKKIAPHVIALQNARYFHADLVMEGGGSC